MRGLVQAEDFSGANAVVFTALAQLLESGAAVDYATLGEHLRACGRLEAAGGIHHIAQLQLDAVAPGNCVAHARIVADYAGRRRLQQALRQGADALQTQGIGHIAPLLLDEVQHALRRADPEQDRGPRVCSAEELLKMELPPRQVLLAPWLLSQSLAMVHAWRGVGKTHFCLNIAHALASGGSFLGWRAVAAVPVLYIDGEMAAVDLQQRLEQIVASSPIRMPKNHLRLITPDLQNNQPVPDLSTHEGQQALESRIGDARVIIADNISCLVRQGKENESESWMPVAAWALRMRALGRSVVFVHHAGKGGQQRGTSKREDLLDTVIALKRPNDYRSEQGARFEIHFEKARSLHGGDAQSMEVQLEKLPDGTQRWSSQFCADQTEQQMIERANLGLNYTEIGQELGCHRSTVMRTLKKAAAEGRYKPAIGGKEEQLVLGEGA